jgi:hypothetical protein
MGDFFGGLKFWAAQNLVEELKKKNPHLPERAVLRMVAPIVNDAFGGQNWHRYWWATPRILQFLNLIMFAPNWTVSAANVAGIGGLTGHAMGNYLSPEQVAFIARNWVSMYLIALQLIPNLFQVAIYWAGSALPGDDDDKEQEKEDKMFAWFNEAGKGDFFPSIDVTPIMRKVPGYSGDPTGRRRIYVRFGKQSYEVLQGWFADPGATLGRKSSMLVKTIWEQITGYSPGSSDFALPFRGYSVMGLVDSSIGFRGSRIGTMASKVLPMTVSSMISNPDSWLTAFFVPASKGISQTRAIQGMVEIMKAYAETGPGGRNSWRPDQKANMDSLAAGYVNALERNGYDAKQVITAAKGKVIPDLYADFYEGFVRKDHGRMHDAAKRIYRIGGTADALVRSAASRNVKTGRKEMSEQDKALVREAFDNALPAFMKYIGG